MASEREAAISLDPASIRLAPGSHSTPREGVCVVELASILGGEEFSDRPRCVCPVIAAFMRSWNDRAAHADRQRLRPYAQLIVGSRGSRRHTRERREICLRWAGDEDGLGLVRRRLKRAWVRLRIGVYVGFASAVRLDEGAGEYAARLAFSRGEREGAFELLDALLATGAEGSSEGPAVGIHSDGGPDANGNGWAERNGAPRRALGDVAPLSSNGDGAPVSGDRGRPQNGNGSTPESSEHRSREEAQLRR
jgi:hypothetical protein